MSSVVNRINRFKKQMNVSSKLFSSFSGQKENIKSLGGSLQKDPRFNPNSFQILSHSMGVRWKGKTKNLQIQNSSLTAHSDRNKNNFICSNYGMSLNDQSLGYNNKLQTSHYGFSKSHHCDKDP